MESIYQASYVSLHVRKSNKAAIGLYRDALGFEVAKVEKKYCESRATVISPHPHIYSVSPCNLYTSRRFQRKLPEVESVQGKTGKGVWRMVDSCWLNFF